MSKFTKDNSIFDNDPLNYRLVDQPLSDAQIKEHSVAGQTASNILLIPLEDEIFMPFMRVSTVLTNPESIASAKKAIKDDADVFLFYRPETISDINHELTTEEISGRQGTFGIITEYDDRSEDKLELNLMLYFQGVIEKVTRRNPYLRGDVRAVVPEHIKNEHLQQALSEQIAESYMASMQYLSEDARRQLKMLLKAHSNDSVVGLHLMIQNSPLPLESRYELLQCESYEQRQKKFKDFLDTENQKLALRSEMAQRASNSFNRRQREEFLRAQINEMREELGETDQDEIEELRLQAEEKEWNEETGRRFEKEVRKLERLNPASADYSVQYTYVETYLSLPWQHCDNSDFSLDEVKRVLDRDHFGLEKVKERIVEQMAVLKLRGDTRAPILCLYGPPGVGKTSLGKSVAEALGRKYVRVALGGLHDEAEIRGHRRTYLGAMPGRILAALERCGTSDPVMVLDEIDKIGADFKGDPQQALLEVLDPEQNCKFHDNFIDQDYDLSRILFIATANSLQTVSSPLLDRMELIEIGGYIEAEKIEIAKRHLIPKNLEEHGFRSDEMKFGDDALLCIIKDYTRESGVRQMEKKISAIMRKQAVLKATQQEFPCVIDEELVRKYLGKAEVFNDTYENNDIPGIVTGLAWTQAGGEILFIESSIAPGKDNKLTLTGNLGDVMKESAVIALQYLRANHERLHIAKESFDTGTIHVHVPEGAVPKDGPSAGITIATSLASTLTGLKVRSHLAMTGEITLRGKVLPVGGIKEKILAAKRAGIRTIMLSEKNRKDIEEIKPEYLEGLEFRFVNTIEEVLDYALLSE